MKKGEKMTAERKIIQSLALKGHPTSDKVRKQCGSIWRGKHPPMEFKKGEPPIKHREGCKCFRCSPIKKEVCISRDRRTYYSNLHHWVKRRLGSPCYCEHCNVTTFSIDKYQWANKSREYKKDVSDWLRLCVDCHREYDKILDLKK